LNRQWAAPTRQAHPTIHAVRALIRRIQKQRSECS
jgi:hypothetical protein